MESNRIQLLATHMFSWIFTAIKIMGKIIYMKYTYLLNTSQLLFNNISHLGHSLWNALTQVLGGSSSSQSCASLLNTFISSIASSHFWIVVHLAIFHNWFFRTSPLKSWLKFCQRCLTQNLCSELGNISETDLINPYKIWSNIY